MPLLDLSQTTLSLRRLLEFNIPLIEPTLALNLTITTLPPERVTGAANLLSLYCYHVAPDGSNRFRPRQPSGSRPIATSPLVLNLTYILTAHTVVDTEFNSLAEQRLLGYAMKTLHDFPVIDDTTEVAGQIVLPNEIRGQHNSFSITMLQLTAGEALNYWANETQTTVKPSCYYEVTSAELDPDPPTRIPGIVLSIGNFVMPKTAPAIAASSGPVPYTLPASAGGGAMSLTASPGRVGPIAAAPPATNQMVLTGSNFGISANQTLHLAHPLWSRHFPGGRVPVDLTLNGALNWALNIADTQVDADVGNTLRAAPPGGGANVDLPLYPGIYMASWTAERQFDINGSPETITERSNSCAVMIYPRITGSARDNGTGRVTLDFGGDWLLTRGRPMPVDPVAAPELDLLLSVDGRTYSLVPDPAPTGPGTYIIADHALTYEPFAEADTAGDHAIRVVVDGADSQPFWVNVP